MAGGNFILGGLLSGAGAGLAMTAQQKREDALEALRNQRQLDGEQRQDQRTIAQETRAEERAIRTEDRASAREDITAARDANIKAGLLKIASENKISESEVAHRFTLDEIEAKGRIESNQIAQRGKQDERLAQIKADLDRRNDRDSQELKQQIDRGEREVIGVDENGFVLVMTGSGTIITTKTKMRDKGGEDGGATIGDARSSRSGAAAPAAAPAPKAAGATKPTAAPNPRQPVEIAEEAQATLDRMTKSGQVPKGVEGQWMTGPNGERAQWVNGRWIIFKMPGATPNRG